VKFIFLKAVAEDDSLSDLSPFKLTTALANEVDSCKIITRYRSGGIPVEAVNEDNSLSDISPFKLSRALANSVDSSGILVESCNALQSKNSSSCLSSPVFRSLLPPTAP